MPTSLSISSTGCPKVQQLSDVCTPMSSVSVHAPCPSLFPTAQQEHNSDPARRLLPGGHRVRVLLHHRDPVPPRGAHRAAPRQQDHVDVTRVSMQWPVRACALALARPPTTMHCHVSCLCEHRYCVVDGEVSGALCPPPLPSRHSLSFSSAGNRAMTALSDSLIDSRSLRTLDLSNCNMDSEGAKAIGVGLQVPQCCCCFGEACTPHTREWKP